MGSHLLSLAERETIEKLLSQRTSFRKIASSIGRSCTCISYEVRGHGGKEGYSAIEAHKEALKMRSIPKIPGIQRDEDSIMRRVEEGVSRHKIMEEFELSMWDLKVVIKKHRTKLLEGGLAERIDVLEMQMQILQDLIKELMKR